jgi:hypothetical protein
MARPRGVHHKLLMFLTSMGSFTCSCIDTRSHGLLSHSTDVKSYPGIEPGAKLRILRTSHFLLELLHTQQKNNVFLNLYNTIHTVKSKFLRKITFDYDFFPTLLWPLESRRFLGNSDSADRLFRGNFRPLKHNIFAQNLHLSMYCNIIFRNITEKYKYKINININIKKCE